MPDLRCDVPSPFRVGARVYLRAVEHADGPRFVRWMNDPANTPFLGGGAIPYNEIREREFIDKMTASATDVVLVACLREAVGDFAADTPFAMAGFHGMDPIHRFATFGICVGETALQDRGLGTEVTDLMVEYAFATLNLERVELSVFDHNPRGLAVYRKLGFVEEGRLIKRRFKGGAWRDEILMAIRREAWTARRTAP